ncbi:ATP-binding cassette domain-containing protein [Marinomonas spartinae]|uniref:branched-chain amino acid ABC transporter ATP-binding protein/permease n=1 Tax=Marinomonas spartinae TaxID=1792290 RepID=UPI0018F124FE|nr:ATP-binding cassette domain-containing protein [Marinomonas spartinae]MBJ7554639.1 branched-chain amino acid ABC transporter ATP-binding protein/permease [Marinomonas spartinae]
MVNVLKKYALGGDCALLLLAIASIWLSSYYTFLFTSVLMTAITCLSIGITTERAGIISLCQVGLSGVGAWVAMWLGFHFPNMPILLILLLSGLSAAILGLLLIVPTLRVRGINLAIITLSFALAIYIVLTRVELPGMMEGYSFDRPDWLYDEKPYLLFVIAITFVISRGIVWIEQQPTGASWFAVRYSERAAASLGINVSISKVMAFVSGAFIAGISGSLLLMQLGNITSQNFEPYASLIIFALAILAKSRFLSGALFAGVLTWFTPQILSLVGLGEWKDIADLMFACGAIFALSQNTKNKVPSAKNAPSETKHNKAEEKPQQMNPDSQTPSFHYASMTLKNISLSYGAVKALNNVSFTLAPGKVTGLIGPNGAGKSSLVDVISGFCPTMSGEITLEQDKLDTQPAFKRANMGLRRTFQQGRAVPELTIKQYIHLASGRQFQEHRLPTLLNQLACPHQNTLIAHIDVGTRRLVEIAGALMSKPKVLLLDEPAAGMSSVESEHLGNLIRQIPALFGCTVLLIEHDMSLIRHVCSDLIVLEYGEVLAAGPVEETLNDPSVVEAYLGAA